MRSGSVPSQRTHRPLPSLMKFELPHKSRVRTSRQSLDLINLELERGLLVARFCQLKGSSASVGDLHRAKAFYNHALQMFSRQTDLRPWQRRTLQRKLNRFELCIRRIEMAAPPVKFAPSAPLAFPAASLLNHKP